MAAKQGTLADCALLEVKLGEERQLRSASDALVAELDTSVADAKELLRELMVSDALLE